MVVLVGPKEGPERKRKKRRGGTEEKMKSAMMKDAENGKRKDYRL